MGAGGITVRRATLNDLETVADLFDLYRQFYEREDDLIAARVFLRDRFERDESIIFLAENDAKRPAGFVQSYRSFSSLGMRKTLILNDLYVMENFRRQGVAEALIEATHDYARANDVASISLQTHPDNKQARALYEKFGYKRDDEYLTYEYSVPRT